jgi:scyllo-inositol 2-dehydrogenase (NADP+)
MGSHHVKLIGNVDRMQVSGIFDINQERLKLAKQNGLHVYSGLEDVLKDSNVDIVLIATPNHVHKNIAVQSLLAGKDVICEKPVTLNTNELQEIIDTAEKCNRLFVVHQNRRWDEDFRVMKKLFDENTLGNVLTIESRVQGSRGIPGDWRKEKEYGGGMLLDWGVHLIDQILNMVNEKVKKVYCKLSFMAGEEVDDGAKLFLTFESGKTAYMEIATSNYISLPRWYMSGTTGTAVIYDWDMSGKVSRLTTLEGKEAKPVVTAAGITKTMAPRDETTTVEESIPRIHSNINDYYNNVMDTIEGKTEIIIKNSQVMRVMKLIEAAFQSNELEQVVDFE